LYRCASAVLWLVIATPLFAGPSLRQDDQPLSLPDAPHDGATINLDCGRIYAGPLYLAGLRDVTVRTAGDCGPAVLTTAVPVSGWQRDPARPSIWMARLGFGPAQLQLGTRFLARAHHPNAPGQWLHGTSHLPEQLQMTLPSSDLAGATLVWRAADWLIETRTIERYEGHTAYLARGPDDGFGLPADTPFYVEGKRWMLDIPGEWAYEAGWLYLWPPDGRSPQGRVWASPRERAIDARDSHGVRIDGVAIFGATLGIDGSGSRGLQIIDTVIENSGEAAVLAGAEMRVVRATVRGSVQDGLRAADDVRDVQVLDSRFDDIGMLGMPRRSRGAIVFEQAQRVIVRRNRIRDAGYIGIRVFRDALVSENEIVRACQRLDDCGGIYTFARDRKPLHVTIERNRISRLGGSSAFAIYLDDFANGVQVTANQSVDNPGGMQLHDAFSNEIAGNAFINSQRQHILFNETAETVSIADNRVVGNRFVSAGDVPVYRLWSRHGGQHVGRFAQFRNNHYRDAPLRFADIEGQGAVGLAQWLAGPGSGDGVALGRKRTGRRSAAGHAGSAGVAGRSPPQLAR
jgi:nitrous oxidase accessory protein NosD